MGIQLNGSSGADIISSSDGTITINGTSTVTNPIVTDTITISDKISHSGDSNTHIRFAGNDTVTVETAGSERLRIDSSGNIKLTPSTYQTLAIKQFGYGSSYQSIMVGNPNSNVGVVALNVDVSGISGSNFHAKDQVITGYRGILTPNAAGNNFIGVFTRDASADKIYFGPSISSGLTNGPITATTSKVGINETSPRHHLTVNSGTTNVAIAVSSTDASSFISYQDNTTGDTGTNSEVYAGATGGSFVIHTDAQDSPRVAVTNGGNVGISSENPTSRLYVNGVSTNDIITARAADANGASAINIKAEGTTGISRIKFSDTAAPTGDGWISYYHSDRAIAFATAGVGNERLRIKSDGNIVATGNLKTNNISGHNIVHNGAFNINQRGVTSSTSTGFQTVDRWRATWGGNSAPITQKHETLTSGAPYNAGFRHSYKLESQGHSGNNQAYCYVVQSIEAQDITNSGWQYTSSSSYINVSFWIKVNVSQNYLFYVHTNDSTIKEYCCLLNLTANTWTKVTKAIPGNSGIVVDDDNGVGLQLWFAAYLGDHYTSGSTVETWQTHAGYTSRPDMGSAWWTQSNATFEITGVQLEVGSTDTPFEHRSYGEELALCQRYYWRTLADNNKFFPGMGMADIDGNTVILNTQFPVRMRSAPSDVEQSGTANHYKIRRSTTQTCTSVPGFGHATLDQAATTFTKSSHGWGDGSAVRCMGGTSGAYLGWSADL